MKTEYEVNVGNIGNMSYVTKKAALECYRESVSNSKEGFGRGGQENVVLMIDGEPCPDHDFNWYNWRISRQEAIVIEHEKELLKAKTILNRLIERQEEDAN